MHVGREYTFVPTKEEYEIAQHLAALKVDAVIGHHPHVVQPVTYIDDTLVIYSLGNFLSSQKEINKKIGLMVSFEVIKMEYNNQKKISINNIEGQLLYVASNSPYGKYIVYPFQKLDNTILNNYQKIFEEYSSYVNIDNTINIKGVE